MAFSCAEGEVQEGVARGVAGEKDRGQVEEGVPRTMQRETGSHLKSTRYLCLLFMLLFLLSFFFLEQITTWMGLKAENQVLLICVQGLVCRKDHIHVDCKHQTGMK